MLKDSLHALARQAESDSGMDKFLQIIKRIKCIKEELNEMEKECGILLENRAEVEKKIESFGKDIEKGVLDHK